MPEVNSFGPQNGENQNNGHIIMSIDEYETIRLIDYESLTQEDCAENMGVARTTVTMIYSEARKKLAKALVDGQALQIKGGDYELCNTKENRCGRRGCHRRHRRGDVENENSNTNQ